MKYEVKSGFCVEVGRDVYPPEVIDLDPRVARQYVEQGRIVPVVEVQEVAAASSAPAALEAGASAPAAPVEGGQGNTEAQPAAVITTQSAAPAVNETQPAPAAATGRSPRQTNKES